MILPRESRSQLRGAQLVAEPPAGEIEAGDVRVTARDQADIDRAKKTKFVCELTSAGA